MVKENLLEEERVYPAFFKRYLHSWLSKCMAKASLIQVFNDGLDLAEMIEEYKKAERQATQQQMKGRLK